MNRDNNRIKIAISGIVILLALLRFIFFDDVGVRIDNTFLLLFAIAILVHIIPWNDVHVTALKVFGVEVALDKPQVKGALEGTGLSPLKSTDLWEKLSHLESDIEQAHGSRVLWIDDNPNVILSERRILRALGIEVVTASSSAKAEDILKEDNDFDLIISDVQREGENPTNVYEKQYGGIYFIKKLRQEYKDDPIISSLPVVFYSAYRSDQIETIKQQVGDAFLDDIKFRGTFDVLLPEVITTLAKARINPRPVKLKKPPTHLG